ncbi:MAG: hypothetical protein EOM64_01690 [Erysipelotrichia bacterium]|nr:hypothetical protein [Erysipelotrichia bacterium]
MKGTINGIKLTEYGISGMPVILIGAAGPEQIARAVPSVQLFGVSVQDWNRDLSPWPAERVFKGGEAFGGQADQLLQRLISLLDERSIPSCMIAGYSLAGLFALYASTKTDRFIGCACCSGSLWYPGFIDYLREHPSLSRYVYLSLGSREKNSKSSVLSHVEEDTREAEIIIRNTAASILVINPGGHFEAESERIASGISWLNNKMLEI